MKQRNKYSNSVLISWTFRTDVEIQNWLKQTAVYWKNKKIKLLNKVLDQVSIITEWTEHG